MSANTKQTIIGSGFSARLLASNHKIIVGVDYGTTYTGASYVSAESTDHNEITIIRSWPGPSKATEAVFKAPSRIAYPEDNRKLLRKQWGFQVQSGMTAYSWTKLLLDQNAPLTKYDDAGLEDASRAGILRLPNGKDAVEVVSDFLSELYQHILKSIAKQITDDILRVTPLEFWFTVPAIWSDQAKDATIKAAQLASFGKDPDRPNDLVFMISEPEAAAIAVLNKSAADRLGAPVKPGDGVLVCDCGGGTVDITTYLVNQVNPVLSFEELCTGIGGKCGSTAVDRNLYKLMSSRFGDAFDSLPPKRKGPGSEFMKKFEIIKGDFGYSSEEEEEVHEVPLNMTVEDPDPKYFDEEEGFVLISNDDLRTIFDPVVDKVISLVRQQINDTNADVGHDAISRIILVGGFGDSEYLRQAFRKSFGSDGKIAVVVPDKPQTMIVRGAAICGLEGLRSTTKRCRRHYGFDLGIPFRDGIDSEDNAYIGKFTNQKMVAGIMEWLIAKGDKYSEDYSRAMNLCRTHYSGNDLKYSDDLYSCDLTEAPERVEHKDVQWIGSIVVDFTNVDLAIFDQKYISGRLTYHLGYSINVIFGARDGVLKFEARAQGKVIGKTSVTFTNVNYY